MTQASDKSSDVAPTSAAVDHQKETGLLPRALSVAQGLQLLLSPLSALFSPLSGPKLQARRLRWISLPSNQAKN